MTLEEKSKQAIELVLETINDAPSFASQIVILCNEEDLSAYRAACAHSEVVDCAIKRGFVLIVFNVSVDTFISCVDPLGNYL